MSFIQPRESDKMPRKPQLRVNYRDSDSSQILFVDRAGYNIDLIDRMRIQTKNKGSRYGTWSLGSKINFMLKKNK